MNEYKLVPVDLLSELAESLASELDARYPASVRSYESQDRKYQAEMEPVLAARQIISAAPAVQGEPVGEVRFELGAPSSIFAELYSKSLPVLAPGTKLYAAPQPAEQQPALTKYQPCGCVVCTCEHETQCKGCGAKHCGTHPVGQIPGPVYQQPAEQQPDPHPDDAAVDRFAGAMKAKLNKKRQEGRGGWQSMSAEQLSTLLHEHVRKGDPVDVANLAMMLHQNGQRIEQQPAPDVDVLVEALERSVAGFDALSGMASLDAGARNYARQKALELNANLAAHRKQQGGQP